MATGVIEKRDASFDFRDAVHHFPVADTLYHIAILKLPTKIIQRIYLVLVNLVNWSLASRQHRSVWKDHSKIAGE